MTNPELRKFTSQDDHMQLPLAHKCFRDYIPPIAMYSSARVGRSLATVPKELSGITLRRPRPQFLFYRERIAQFSTARSVYQAGIATISREDSHIPIEAITIESDGNENRQSNRSNIKLKDSEQHAQLDDEWHAEVEIKAPMKDHEIQRNDNPDAESFSIKADEASSNLPKQLGDHDAPVSTATPPPEVDGQPHEQTASTRRQSRIDRKLQRQEAGLWAPKKQARMAKKSETSSMDHVLTKIDAMEDGDAPKNHLAILEGRKVKMSPKARFNSYERKPREAKADVAKSGSPKDAKADPTKSEKPAKTSKKDERENWQIQKAALAEKFGEVGWQPRKRLSPDTLEGIRALHKADPAAYSTEMLAQHFKISPDAIRRILKSKWRPSEEEVEDRRQRWEKRGIRKWEEMAKQGARPPAKWRALGVKSPEARKREMEKSAGKSEDDEYVKWSD